MTEFSFEGRPADMARALIPLLSNEQAKQLAVDFFGWDIPDRFTKLEEFVKRTFPPDFNNKTAVKAYAIVWGCSYEEAFLTLAQMKSGDSPSSNHD